MAIGPDGTPHAAQTARPEGMNPAEHELTTALERTIDLALKHHRGRGPFVYGIHQSVSPGMAEAIVRRYRDAGWSDASLADGATGTRILVLHP